MPELGPHHPLLVLKQSLLVTQLNVMLLLLDLVQLEVALVKVLPGLRH